MKPDVRLRTIVAALALPVLAGTFSGCAMIEDLLQMHPLTVTDHSPARRHIDADALDSVSIGFSRPVARTRAEQAFSLDDETGTVSGRFAWNRSSKQMAFHPHRGFASGRRYRVSLSTAVEDRHGNSLDRELSFVFRTGHSDQSPGIVSVYPADRTVVMPQFIRIEFSAPMDRQSVYRAVRITPAIRSAVTWDTDSSVITFRPTEALSRGTEYLIAIGREAHDIHGNRMQTEQRYRFTAGHAVDIRVDSVSTTRHRLTLLPDTERLFNHDAVEIHDQFEVVFGAPLPISALAGAIGFAPSLPHRVQWNETFDRCTIVPLQPMTWNAEYELTVVDIRYRFTVTGPHSVPPQLHGVAFSADPAHRPFQPLELSDSVELIPGAPLETENDRAVFDIAVVHANGSSIPLGSFLQAYRTVSRNGVFSFILHTVTENPTDSWFPPASDITVFRLESTIRRVGPAPFDIVSFELGASLSDSYKNRAGQLHRIEVNGR